MPPTCPTDTADRAIRFTPVDLGDADDGTALCAILDTGAGDIVASINARYPEAEAHVRAHVARGFDTVLICTPECDGTQR